MFGRRSSYAGSLGCVFADHLHTNICNNTYQYRSLLTLEDKNRG